MVENDQAVPEAEEPRLVHEPSLIEKVVGVFTSPRQTFEAIAERPSWLIPYILVCVIGFGSFYLTRDVVLNTQIERIQNNPNLSQEQIDTIVERMERSSTGTGIIWQVVSIPVVTLVVFAIVAGVLMFGGNVVLGGAARFKQLFSIYAWSSLISALSAIVKTPLILATGSISVGTSLAVFMPADSYTTFLYNFLAKFDVFSIWQLIVVTIGISVLYRFTMRRSLIMVGSFWFVYVLLSAGLGVLTQGMMQFG